jgi:hypothetical protein
MCGGRAAVGLLVDNGAEVRLGEISIVKEDSNL